MDGWMVLGTAEWRFRRSIGEGNFGGLEDGGKKAKGVKF